MSNGTIRNQGGQAHAGVLAAVDTAAVAAANRMDVVTQDGDFDAIESFRGPRVIRGENLLPGAATVTQERARRHVYDKSVARHRADASTRQTALPETTQVLPTVVLRMCGSP